MYLTGLKNSFHRIIDTLKKTERKIERRILYDPDVKFVWSLVSILYGIEEFGSFVLAGFLPSLKNMGLEAPISKYLMNYGSTHHDLLGTLAFYLGVSGLSGMVMNGGLVRIVLSRKDKSFMNKYFNGEKDLYMSYMDYIEDHEMIDPEEYLNMIKK